MWCTSLAALAATALDGAAYVWTSHAGWLAPGRATAFGACLGGVLNFALNRTWAFGSGGRMHQEAWRYAWVSLAGGVFCSALVYLWTRHAPQTHPCIVWAVVKCAVSWGFGLPMQRYYVFGAPRAL